MKNIKLLMDALETFPNVVVIDKKGLISWINSGYARLLGQKQDDCIGRPVTEIIPNTKMMDILESGQPDIGSLMNLYDHTQGQEVTVVCNRMPVFRDGKIVGAAAITTTRDVIETVTRLSNEVEAIRQENEQYRQQLDRLMQAQHPLDRIVGNSAEMKEVKQVLSDFAASNLPILITGETGVGKELFARATHELSNRKLKNYIKVNCAAIPKDLLESELFGYEPGAFTGAAKGGKPGKFELANEGTLLLDEIGEMPLTLQSKLLRVLQEKELERVGSLHPVKVDVRIICSTNRDLEKMVEEGTFRKDLYYRINTVELSVPPLRQRPSDIPALCQYFIDMQNAENGTHLAGISREVMDFFYTYTWPGNIRELEHVIQRLAAVKASGQVEMEDCAFLVRKARPAPQQWMPDYLPVTLSDTRRDAEREAIVAALKAAGGNKTAAAQMLDIDRSMLYYKIKKLGIQTSELFGGNRT